MILQPVGSLVSPTLALVSSYTMPSFKYLFLLTILVNFFKLSASTTQQVTQYFDLKCPKNLEITDRSYSISLNQVLSSLSSEAANNEFYKTATNNITTSETVYGLFLCRGDTTSEPCRECVSMATQELRSRCSSVKEAIIWYDQCFARYSNRSFFHRVEIRPRCHPSRDLAHVDFKRLNKDQEKDVKSQFKTAMNETAASAADDPQKFSTNQVQLWYNSSFSEFSGRRSFLLINFLAQCTPDLSSKDCAKCLTDAMQDILGAFKQRQGGVLFPSCYLRYATNPIFNQSLQKSPAPAPTTAPTPIPTAPVPVLAPIPTTGGPDYPRIAPMATPAGLADQTKGRRKIGGLRMAIVVAIPVAILIMLFCPGCYFLRRKADKSRQAILRENFGEDSASLESLKFDLAMIEAATNNFSYENRIGIGGFGEVYKGIFPDGREIAVKRLSKNSEQGSTEFKNEILLIAKLQHRNLVALLGFCLEGQEKILVYEYVPNKSLDYFLFDSENHRLLSWYERYEIIRGIGQAILYLHDYSRLKVIHRDLKPANVLLDKNMNPKVSDFGMARMVGLDQEKGSTMRIVGTYGYMPPEYAMLGQFSEKSDVYSFGVMILEIISGKENSSSYESDEVVGLLDYAWRKWKDQTPLDILDPNLKESYSEYEVIRCIEIGLLCVQENPDDRPTMAMVHSYLSNLSMELPFPREPAFYMHGRMKPDMFAIDLGQSASNAILSVNEMPQ